MTTTTNISDHESARNTLLYLRRLGLHVPGSASFVLSSDIVYAAQLFPIEKYAEISAAERGTAPLIDNVNEESEKARSLLDNVNKEDDLEQAFQEAFTSALTKFDSLESYFATGMSVPEVSKMLAEEMQQDKDFITILAAPQHDAQLQALLKTTVGRAFGEWKKNGGASDRAKLPSKAAKLKDNPLPWSSIDAYPEWVVNQIENYASTEPEAQSEARRSLEFALLEKPLCAASVKYDGTCFGKLDTGELVGRKQVLGKACDQYQHTSTAAAEPCNVAAVRCELSKMLDAELGAVCVWGELMCNPGYYSYKARGLTAKWLCFGVVVALNGFSDEELQRISQQLTLHGFAHSMSPGGKLRMVLCPALRQLLVNVACCDVADEVFQGSTHAELVAKAAAGLSAGNNEGLVLVFMRNDGQASLRKWKNSAEGASVSKKHAQLLCSCRDRCLGLVSAGLLDARIAEMVETMQRVAEAETSPFKTGRSKV